MKKLVFGLLALTLILLVTGCGFSGEATPPGTVTYRSNDQYSIPGTTTLIIPAAESASSGGIFGGSDKGSGESAPGPQIIVNAPPPVVTPTLIHGAGDTSYGTVQTIERMVIKTASVALVVEDVNTTLQQITNLADANGGYVINSDIREDQNRLFANINFRVEAAKFNQTILSLHNMAVEVRSESTSGQDVTEEYVDLDAKLRNLEASETQLLALMEKAGTVEDILKVQQQLVATRSDIEQIKGRMQYLQQSSSLSSIYASLEQSKLVVEFNASSTTMKEGGKIRFYPSISGGFEPYSFEWNFGDGGTSTEGSPLHSYKKDGVYTVTLTIKDDKANTATAERKDYITVLSGWDAGNVVSNSWNGLVGFGRVLGSIFIGLGIFSPVWIAILVILYFAWWRRRKKKA